MEQFNRPPPLSFEGNISENWRRFYQQTDVYLTAADKAESADKTKIAILLNLAGVEALEVFNTFVFADGDKDKYKPVCDAFNKYCNPRKNVVYERYGFWSIKQDDGETVGQFVTRLRGKIKDCEYRDSDDMIRDKLVFAIRNNSVKERLLREENLTLTKAIDIARASEMSKEQVQVMTTSQASKTQLHVNHIKSQRNRQDNSQTSARRQDTSRTSNAHSSNTEVRRKNDGRNAHASSDCSYCGYSHAENKCPAFNKTCNYCKKKGHFTKVCRRKSYNMSKNVRTVNEETYSSDELNDEDLVLYAINQDDDLKNDSDWQVTMKIANSRQVRFKIDTGADCNVISKRVFDKLKLTQKTQKTKSRLIVYSGSKLTILGKITLDCEYKNQIVVLTFNIVDEDLPCILGLPGINELGLVKRVYNVNTSEQCSDEIMEEFNDVFHGLGCITGVSHKIQIKEDAIPVVHPPRRVPVALREPLKQELERMEKLDVIQRVQEPTEWVNSLVIVRKKNNKLRVCMDPSNLNKAIKREHYPMKTVEEVVSRIPNAKIFSVLDANHGFWQLKLDTTSQQLCTMNTPFGRYSFKRLPFGVASAPEVFQSVMVQLFEDLEGVEVIVDDLLVWGETMDQHDERLRKVLERARERNLKLNEAKCQFRMKEVSYVGHVITENGLKPDPKKIEAIQAMKRPECKEDLLRFLGVITYLAKFIGNMSDLAAPLREVIAKDHEWHWERAQEESFEKLKTAITSAPVLAFFDTSLPVVLSVDSSSKGMGACLMQNDRPIAYASKSLTTSQKNYAQIEKEMLAIVFGCERFHEYVYGQPCVVVESDHKPLEMIFRKPLHQAPMRLQKMLLKLQKYQLQVTYKPGSELYIADTLSRAALNEEASDLEDEYEVFFMQSTEASEMKTNIEKLQEATANDQALQTLIRVIRQGWPAKKDEIPFETEPYWNHRDVISDYNGLVFKSDKVIIPETMRAEILTKLHAGHLGIEKCLARARTTVYWPGMNGRIKELIAKCTTCLQFKRQNRSEPLKPHSIPDRPWEKVGVDYFYFKGSDYLLVVDFYSKYPEVINVTSKTAETTITAMKSIFARHGIPNIIIADNMPFNSRRFKQFASEWDIRVITSSPNYAQSNGMAERTVQTIKQLFRKAEHSGDDPYVALLNYRNTPITDLDLSPAELLMGRTLRTTLPTPEHLLKPTTDVKHKLLKRQNKQKKYFDRHAGKCLSTLHPGNVVRVRIPTEREWTPATVLKSCTEPRSYIVKTPEGNELRRNRKHLMETNEPPPPFIDPPIENISVSDTSPTTPLPENSSPATATDNVTRTRCGRAVVLPKRYQ